MKALRKILATVLLFSAGAVASWAAGESTTVRFRFGKAEADLSKLEALLSGTDASRIVGVEVRASSSPDGPYWVNKTLAQDRSSYIINKVKELCPSLGDDAIKSTIVAEDWTGVAGWLRRCNKPWKDEALKIVTEGEASTREEKLQDLFAGEAWDEMMRSAFPALRSARVTLVLQDARPELVVTEEQKAKEDTVSKASLEVKLTQVQSSGSSIQILFPAGIRYVRPEYQDNRTAIDILKVVAEDGKPLTIRSYASPEGSPTANAALAKNRAECVRQYLTGELGVSEDRITVESCGEDWAGLAREAGKSYGRANRDDVLSILSDDSLSGGQKKAAIRALDGNATWQYLITNQMAILRSVIVSVE
jgi:outer membrane protein OmpA-like peptidoglycan-associated protein